MRSLYALLCMVVLLILDTYAMAADFIIGNKSGVEFNIKNDTVIVDGVYLDFARINVNDAITLENNGDIYGDLYLCSDCVAAIRNRGNIYGVIHVGTNGGLVQLISDVRDAVRINVDGAYNVAVSDVEMISVGDIFGAAGDAGKIIIANSVIMIDSVADPVGNGVPGPNIEFVGENIIYIPDLDAFNGTAVLSNVSGDGSVHFHAENVNPLYALKSIVEDGDLYLTMVRETDYSKILKNPVGDFLNQLRKYNPTDGLLKRMDLASDMNELNRAMSHSARLNPILLMRSTDIVDRTVFGVHIARENILSADTFAIVSDNFGSYGARARAGLVIGDGLFVDGAIYSAIVDFDNGMDEYMTHIYGANFRAVFDLSENYFVRTGVGASVSKFDIGPVFDGRDATYNPRGINLYGVSDVGMKIDIGDGVDIGLFSGMRFNNASVAGDAETNLKPYIGGDVLYGFETAGLRYDYGGHCVFYSDGAIESDLKISILSIMDDAGGDFSIGIIHNEMGTSYKFSVSINYMF